MRNDRVRTCVLLAVGACVGVAVHALMSNRAQPAHAEEAAPPAVLAAADQSAQMALIKGKLGDQGHAMQDVGSHYANLWFAGEQQNWGLANFYWSEGRDHLRWAVRMNPHRKDASGQPVDMADILKALENGPLAEVHDAIVAKDKTRFETAYHHTLEGCYGCHKASSKPFIRLQIPTAPESPIVNFDPQASWPM
jgi:hypothetical protein